MQELFGIKSNKKNYSIDKNTADLTGVANIFDGIVYKTDKSVQTLISITPINMSLMTKEDMLGLGKNMTAALNTDEIGFRAYSQFRSVNLDTYIKSLQALIDFGEIDKARKALAEDLINNANNIALKGEINSRLYYIILTQEAVGNKATDMIRARTDEYVRALRQFNIDAKRIEDEEIIKLYMLYADDFVATQLPTQRDKLGIPMLDEKLIYDPEKSYKERNRVEIPEITKKKKKEVIKVDARDEERNGKILNMIAPDGVEFESHYFTMGNKYCVVIEVLDYPTDVDTGWLSNITTIANTITSIDVKVTNPSAMIKGLNNSISEYIARANRSNNANDKMLNQKGADDAQRLLENISLRNEKVVYTNITILIKADTHEQMVINRQKVISILASKSIRAVTLGNRQREGFDAVSPYGKLPEDIYKFYSKNMPMSTLAYSLPFSDAGINDLKGIYLGTDASNGIILINQWPTSIELNDRNNRNWAVLGQPGTGKSTLIKSIAMQEYLYGATIIAFDPEKEYTDICKYYNGQIINPMTSEGRINPFEIKDDLEYMDDEDDTKLNRSPLATQIRSLRTFFKLYATLDEEDIAYLEEIIEKIYADKGITWETEIKNISKQDYPIMMDLLNEINNRITQTPDNKKLEKLRVLIRKAAEGADSEIFNGQSNGRLDANFIDVNLAGLKGADGRLRQTQYYNILQWAWLQVQKARETGKRIFLLVDEAYLLIDEDNPEALKFLMTVSKRIRKYGGGLMVISHSAVDFNEVGREGRALLTNPTYKVLFGSDGQDLKDLEELYDLTKAESSLIESRVKGSAVFMCGKKRVHLKVDLTNTMFEIMGTAGGK